MKSVNFRGLGLAVLITALVCTVISSEAAQNTEGGKELFEKRCGGCHALDRDQEGPRLRTVYGRAAASSPGFGYSRALRKSGIVWDEKTLDAWLSDTERLVPGNDMEFRVEKAEERREIIRWLRENAGG